MRIGPRTHGGASCKVNFCDAIPNRRHDIREITHIWCDPAMRRDGNATALLEKLCEEADSKLMVMVLNVASYGENPGLDAEGLEKFYSKFGFQVIQSDGHVMARPPYPARYKIAQEAAQ